MTLKEFNRKYVYKTDKDNYGRVEHWQVMKPNANGVHEGDCEDYCLTLQKKVEGFDSITLWYCKVGEDGHCIGQTPDGLFIDCNFKTTVARVEMEARGYNSFKKFWITTIWFKMLQAKVQRWLA